MNPPVGCGFGSRCENCMKICNEEQPEQFAVGENHVASCWLLHKDCPPELRGGANNAENKKKLIEVKTFLNILR